MPNQWYVRRDGKIEGPLSNAELRQQAAIGQITPLTELCQAAGGKWIVAGRIRELFETPPKTFPPPPPLPAMAVSYQPPPPLPRLAPVLSNEPSSESESTKIDPDKSGEDSSMTRRTFQFLFPPFVLAGLSKMACNEYRKRAAAPKGKR